MPIRVSAESISHMDALFFYLCNRGRRKEEPHSVLFDHIFETFKIQIFNMIQNCNTKKIKKTSHLFKSAIWFKLVIWSKYSIESKMQLWSKIEMDAKIQFDSNIQCIQEQVWYKTTKWFKNKPQNSIWFKT